MNPFATARETFDLLYTDNTIRAMDRAAKHSPLVNGSGFLAHQETLQAIQCAGDIQHFFGRNLADQFLGR